MISCTVISVVATMVVSIWLTGCTAEYAILKTDIRYNATVNGAPLTDYTGPLNGTCDGKKYNIILYYCSSRGNIKSCNTLCGRHGQKSIDKCRRECRLFYMCNLGIPINITKANLKAVCRELFIYPEDVIAQDSTPPTHVTTAPPTKTDIANTGTPNTPDQDTNDNNDKVLPPTQTAAACTNKQDSDSQGSTNEVPGWGWAPIGLLIFAVLGIIIIIILLSKLMVRKRKKADFGNEGNESHSRPLNQHDTEMVKDSNPPTPCSISLHDLRRSTVNLTYTEPQSSAPSTRASSVQAGLSVAVNTDEQPNQSTTTYYFKSSDCVEVLPSGSTAGRKTGSLDRNARLSTVKVPNTNPKGLTIAGSAPYSITLALSQSTVMASW